jgi:N-glycosylase/DNA lyase
LTTYSRHCLSKTIRIFITEHLPYFGLRLLRQEPFETLISFMCAQGIGVSLIRRQVLLLSQNFGEFIAITEYKFPTPNALAHADLSQLAQCTNNNLIRARNIQQVAQAVTRMAI